MRDRALLVMACLVLAGCATMSAQRFQELAQENRRHLSELDAGMSEEAVRARMGKRRVGSLTASVHNPDRSEMWWGQKQTYIVDYYVTEATTPNALDVQVIELTETPVVFAGGVLIGWGDDFWRDIKRQHRLSSSPRSRALPATAGDDTLSDE